MGNFVCDNYYCQSISFKPEWLSESSWNINFIYEESKKPYNINKGVLKINDVNKFNLLLSKKLLLNFNEIKNIMIPINFRYYLNNDLDIYIIFSNKEIQIDNINEKIDLNNSFFIKLKFMKKKITIYRSFNDKIITHKINSEKINSFNISIENNFKILLITEKLFNKKIIYQEKYLNFNQFDDFNDFYLNIYIDNKNPIIKNEFVELNLE